MGLFAAPNSVNAVTPLVGEILVESEMGSHDEVSELHLFYNRPTSGAVLCACAPAIAASR